MQSGGGIKNGKDNLMEPELQSPAVPAGKDLPSSIASKDQRKKMDSSARAAEKDAEHGAGNAKAPGQGRNLKLRVREAEPWLQPLFVFVFAFALRWLYVCVFLEHRIAHFGDAYNFLRSGTCLLQAVQSSHNFMDFLAKIYHAPAAQAQILQSMTSFNLTDRLLIDGPIFPAYLALIEWISGVNAFKPIFDAYSQQLCLCNAALDALSCLLIYFCGRLAFERKTGLIAGLSFALYPPAIINTQHCYSEPFSYFLLCIWTALGLSVLLRHTKARTVSAPAWTALGLSTGALMLSKPAFVLLAPMALAALLPISIMREMNSRQTNESFVRSLLASIMPLLRKYAINAAFAALGLSIVLAPWVCFNHSASGQYSVFVNRVPSFNIFHGNQLRTDGWRCYPYCGSFPGDTKLVLASLLEDAKEKPLAFIGLQFKKIARLWSGVWNEYHYLLFGLSLQFQSLIHQLLLLCATVSLSYLLFRSRHKTLSRSFSAATLLGTIIAFHFAYIPFEAISRYAITAMPAVVLLSAFLINKCFDAQQSTRNAFIKLLLAASCSLLLISSSGELSSSFASLLPIAALEIAPYLALALDGVSLFFCFVLLQKLLCALQAESKEKNRKIFMLIPGALCTLTFMVAAFYTIQSFDWREWHCALNSKQQVRQVIQLPSIIGGTNTAFVLIDLSSQTLAAPIAVKVNGQLLSEKPFPLAQLQPNNSDILQCLAIQGEGMSLDLRSYRMWWVLPFEKTILKAGQKNLIEVSCPEDSAKACVYGDFPQQDASRQSSFLPSLRSFSYTKGFTTFDHRDPRVFEEIRLQGKTVESSRSGGRKGSDECGNSQDLSEAIGKQYGSFRIRLMIPAHASASVISADPADPVLKNQPHDEVLLEKQTDANLRSKTSTCEPIELVGEQPQLVIGANPASFTPQVPVIKLGSDMPAGTRIYFSCQTRAIKGNQPCFVKLAFSGVDKNNTVRVWNSMWQPIGIPASKEFKETTFSDFIPEDILRLKNLEIRPLFSPCLPDYVFLKRKQAIKTSMEIRRARLFFLRPLSIPSLENRTWTVY